MYYYTLYTFVYALLHSPVPYYTLLDLHTLSSTSTIVHTSTQLYSRLTLALFVIVHCVVLYCVFLVACCVCADHEAVARVLVEAKADVNSKKKDEATALMLAADEGHTETVQVLAVECKADVNLQNKVTSTR